MADEAVDAVLDQRMPGLDGNQPAEPAAEHEDRPKALVGMASFAASVIGTPMTMALLAVEGLYRG